MHFPIADAHTDAVWRVWEGRGTLKSGGQFSLDMLGDYPRFTQIFALWATESDYTQSVMGELECFYREKEAHPEINLCLSGADMKETGLNAFLSIEGGEAIGNSLGTLRFFYQRGVRLMTLMWNHDNLIGGGAMEDGRLTDFGREVLSEMKRLGMIVDISHANRNTFYDVTEAYDGAIFASHSNSDAVHPHRRNLTDDQFRILTEREGLAGLNLYPEFLGGNTLSAAVSHIEHFMALGGEKHICLGCDFDGIDQGPEDCPTAEHLYRLGDALLSRNYAEDTVRDILYRNLEDFLRRNLR